MTDAIAVSGLSKSYVVERNAVGRVTRTVDAVKDVDLHVASGETLALVGESGAGKSTIGRLVLRLIEPDAGRIELLGQAITALDRRQMRRMRTRATMIFQDPYKSLNPRLFIGSSIAEPMAAVGDLSRRDRRDRTVALLERVGLGASYLDRFPYEMSGGQLQRVGIARALATDPDVIVCDEPVAALDMSIRSQVINLLRDIQRERNLAYLFISHDLSLVRVIADRVAVMRRGEIVENGATESLFEAPSDSYTKTLLSAIPQTHPRRRTFRPPPSPIDSASSADVDNEALEVAATSASLSSPAGPGHEGTG